MHKMFLAGIESEENSEQGRRLVADPAVKYALIKKGLL